MEKLTQSLSAKIKPVKLFKSDILHIIELFKEASTEIKIRCNNWQLQSVEELLSWQKGKVTELEISIPEPRLSLRLSQSDVWLYSSVDDVKSKGLFEKIKQFLEGKTRRFTGYFSLTVLPPGLIGIGLGNFYLIDEPTDPSKSTIVFSLVVIVIGALLLYRAIKIERKEYAILRIHENQNEDSFLQRNGDSILLSLISAIIGSVLTFIGQWLAK